MSDDEKEDVEEEIGNALEVSLRSRGHCYKVS
jgi:hypothetical protein